MKKKITYLYFDDKQETALGVKDNLDSSQLNIWVEEELPWEEIIDFLLKNIGELDGLILDWRLDGEDDSVANFSSEALAQQCRRMQVDKIKNQTFGKSFPIILCSSQPGFKNLHDKDTTSANLFDGIFEKNILEDQGDFLISLSTAYKTLSKDSLSIEEIIGVPKIGQHLINVDFLKKINQIKDKQPHETIKFLLDEVLSKKGVLINEKILAARLGINMKSEGWKEVKCILERTKYSGILHEVFDRWWSEMVNEWWYEEMDGNTLRYLTAQERIKLLQKKDLGIKGALELPSLADGADSYEFWTVCYGTEAPLAEIDGFTIDLHLHYSWQEKEYISLNEAKNETYRFEKWNSLVSYEEERLKSYFEDSTK